MREGFGISIMEVRGDGFGYRDITDFAFLKCWFGGWSGQ